MRFYFITFGFIKVYISIFLSGYFIKFYVSLIYAFTLFTYRQFISLNFQIIESINYKCVIFFILISSQWTHVWDLLLGWFIAVKEHAWIISRQCLSSCVFRIQIYRYCASKFDLNLHVRRKVHRIIFYAVFAFLQKIFHWLEILYVYWNLLNYSIQKYKKYIHSTNEVNTKNVMNIILYLSIYFVLDIK